MVSHWRVLFVVFAMFGLSACTLAGSTSTPEPIFTPTPESQNTIPEVTIASPENGDEMRIGEDVLVSATATDPNGVTSVQLFANDSLVKTVSSLDVNGDTSLPVVLDYTPRATGDLQLRVVAYRGTVASSPVEVMINVLEEEQEVTVPIDQTTGPVIDPNDPTCRILTNVNLNYRTGPGINYDRLGTFSAGEQIPIIGRVGDNSWWQVQTGFNQVWVSSDYTTEYGNCLSIPIVAIPPTPTGDVPTPTNTPTITPTATLQPAATATLRPADLIVVEISGDEVLTLSGGEVTARYSVMISNMGDSASGQFTATLTYLPNGDTVELGTVSNLEAGESMLLSADLTFTSAGQFTVQAFADSEETVTELSDVNNLGTFIVNVE